MKIEIYILTYDKKISQKYNPNLYKPLICGSNSVKETYNYLCDNTYDNISNLNEYYTELTGEYWAWKNSNADIIGFCHYRRWLVKNLKFDKLNKKDILDDLKEYDIIMPHNFKVTKSIYEFQKEVNLKSPNYDVDYEDYIKIEQILRKISPEYLKSYQKVMNGNMLYSNNIFICKKELADDYFKWLFMVLKEIMKRINLKKYETKDKRICGFIAERLLTTFVVKNDLKIKEYDIYNSELLMPHIPLITCRSAFFYNFMFKLHFFIVDLRKIIPRNKNI